MARDELAMVKSVESEWGSLEELAYELVVRRPELLDSGIEGIATGLGLPVRVVQYLMRESREFQGLLDGLVAGHVWSPVEREAAYRVLVDRVRAGRDRLGESVRAMEYLDSKVGLQKERSGRPSVAIQIVQEGDGSWESDYEGLSFGGRGRSGVDHTSDVVDVEFE